MRRVDARQFLDEVCRDAGPERDLGAVIAPRGPQPDGAREMMPPVTSVTDMRLHAFAVELAEAVEPQYATVMKLEERDWCPWGVCGVAS